MDEFTLTVQIYIYGNGASLMRALRLHATDAVLCNLMSHSGAAVEQLALEAIEAARMEAYEKAASEAEGE